MASSILIYGLQKLLASQERLKSKKKIVDKLVGTVQPSNNVAKKDTCTLCFGVVQRETMSQGEQDAYPQRKHPPKKDAMILVIVRNSFKPSWTPR